MERDLAAEVIQGRQDDYVKTTSGAEACLGDCFIHPFMAFDTNFDLMTWIWNLMTSNFPILLP